MTFSDTKVQAIPQIWTKHFAIIQLSQKCFRFVFISLLCSPYSIRFAAVRFHGSRPSISRCCVQASSAVQRWLWSLRNTLPQQQVKCFLMFLLNDNVTKKILCYLVDLSPTVASWGKDIIWALVLIWIKTTVLDHRNFKMGFATTPSCTHLLSVGVGSQAL